MLLGLLMYAVSCTNPEDRATGNPDSTSFNQSGTDQNLNTGASAIIDSQPSVTNSDTAATPSTSNPNDKTDGSNRSYIPGSKDSSQKK